MITGKYKTMTIRFFCILVWLVKNIDLFYI